MAKYDALKVEFERELLRGINKAFPRAKVSELADTLVAVGEVDQATLKTAGIVIFGNSGALSRLDPESLDKFVQQLKAAQAEERARIKGARALFVPDSPSPRRKTVSK